MSITMAKIARQLWQGLSSDTKPTDLRVETNDVFLETDTGHYFIWNGSTWSLSNSRPLMRTA